MKNPSKKTLRRVTQDDVARRAGVSRSVVSYVLNDTSRTVAAETRERILEAIEDLGYRPNQAAQSLGLGRENPRALRQIGIVLPHVDRLLRPYYSEILAGIHLQAHGASYHVRFIRFFDELRDPVLFNSLIHDEEIAGLLLIALDQCLKTTDDERLIDQIVERISNIVCVEWRREGLSSVSFDRQEAAFVATKHLLDAGHRQVIYIGESDQRISGFRLALLEAGLPSLTEQNCENAFDMKTGFEAARSLMRRRPESTALVCGSDEVAFGALRWFDTQGIAVPRQMGIVSIDNLAMSEFSQPPLTTVNVQKAAMGRQAVQMLLDRGRPNAVNAPPVSVLLPTQLIVRDSSGTKPELT